MTKYTTQQVQAGIKFLSNANVNMDVEYDGDERQVHFNIATAEGTRFWTSGDSIWSKQVQKGVLVKGISLMATYTNYGEDDYWSGGLTGNIGYDGSGKNGTWYDGGEEDTGWLINRIPDATSDGLIYTDDGFVKNLIKYLRDECDFDTSFVDLTKYLDFDYSEQGMQDDGAVNLDVDMDGDFWIKCNEELTKFAVGEEQVA